MSTDEAVFEFADGVGAVTQMLERCRAKGFVYEEIVLGCALIDAWLRVAITLRRRHLQLAPVDDHSLLRDGAEPSLDEREVFALAQDVGAVSAAEREQLERVFQLRNVAVHRFILADVKVADLEATAREVRLAAGLCERASAAAAQLARRLADAPGPLLTKQERRRRIAAKHGTPTLAQAMLKPLPPQADAALEVPDGAEAEPQVGVAYETSNPLVQHFMEGLASAGARGVAAGRNGALLESLCLSVSVIDAVLRMGLVLKFQLVENSLEVPEGLIVHGKGRARSERAVHDLALKKGVIPADVHARISSAYTQRNRMVHAYVRTKVTTRDVLLTAVELEELVRVVTAAIGVLEREQIETGRGMARADVRTAADHADAVARAREQRRV